MDFIDSKEFNNKMKSKWNSDLISSKEKLQRTTKSKKKSKTFEFQQCTTDFKDEDIFPFMTNSLQG